MKRIGFYALLLGLAIASSLGGFYLHQKTQSAELQSIDSSSPAVVFGDRRPDFTFPNLDGVPQAMSQWDGKVVLINFWASWCPPCIREIPALEKIYKNYREQGVEVVGIALDEPRNIRDFLTKIDVSYTMLHGQLDVNRLMKVYGNKLGTLPQTVVINSQGNYVASASSGELHYAEIEALLAPYLPE